MSDFLMSQRELAKWAERLAADDWGRQTWESIALGVSCGALWLLCILVLVGCLVPPIRRRIHSWTGIYLPWNIAIAALIITNLVGIMGHPAIFSSGVVAYWINTTVPASVLEPLAEALDFLAFAGWFRL
ncbi:MAG: hypothetical protein ACK5M8_05910 [Shewanella algae]